ncbi:MAG: flagellar assembly protein FliW, partial [Proteobacteria bacterium]|nr:flagellar assembly protein FliW [Pseudomonadota bacterium]
MTETIKIKSTRFGDVELPADKVITLPGGIPGFEKLKKYVLLDHGEDGLFKWLQSSEDPDIAFLLTIPELFIPGFKLPEKGIQLSSIELKDSEDAVVMVMVCVPGEEQSFITLNIKGPIVFNNANMTGVQCIIDNDDYPCDYR